MAISSAYIEMLVGGAILCNAESRASINSVGLTVRINSGTLSPALDLLRDIWSLKGVLRVLPGKCDY